MYEQFFNLKMKPFELVPNPDLFFLSRGHKKALTYLEYGINENIGFILLTGEVGCGKTTLIRNLVKNLNGDASLSKVFNTKVTSDELISLINEDFGLGVTGKHKAGMLRELNDFLIDQHARRRQPILIVDEAQNLDAELLEEIRLLSNLETNMSKLLQIVLVGQPEIRKTLSVPALRQLRQRISISCHIQPLTREESEEYIYHRLKKAGGGNAARFQDGTLDIVHEFSRGIPRLVNIMCDFLMLTAYTSKTTDITVESAEEVAAELESENRFWQDEVPVQQAPPRNMDELSERLVVLETRMRDETARMEEARRESPRISAEEGSVRKELRQLRSQLWETEVRVRTLAEDFSEMKRSLLSPNEAGPPCTRQDGTAEDAGRNSATALKNREGGRKRRKVGSQSDEREQDAGLGPKWYALYVKSRSDFVTEKELKGKGIETFLPRVKRPRQWKDRRKLVEFPLFQGYLFFRVAGNQEQFLRVLQTKGAVSILSRKRGFPTPVSDREIESLKAVVANEEIINIYPHLKEGMQVRVRRGLLAGAEGVLQNRADHYLFIVNIELLGRSVAVKIYAEDVEPA